MSEIFYYKNKKWKKIVSKTKNAGSPILLSLDSIQFLPLIIFKLLSLYLNFVFPLYPTVYMIGTHSKHTLKEIYAKGKLDIIA